MSDPFLPETGQLRGCGCCEGTSAETPTEVTNPPAQSTVQRRVGRYGEFVESLEAALGREIASDSEPSVAPLRQLTTRSTDDFTIALLDAWAAACDVLTFYQERISNETYRRTASERKSLYELARLIGYRPTPGAAASVDLAFTLDDFEGVPPIHTELPAGLKVQSVPLGDETPQLYETTETIQARSEWNTLKVRIDQPQELTAASEFVVLAGDALNVTEGDTLLFVFDSGSTAIRDVVWVEVDATEKLTTVAFVPPPVAPPAFVRPEPVTGTVEQITATELDDAVVSEILTGQWLVEDLAALCALKGWDEQELENALNEAIEDARASSATSVFVFRQRAAVFGYNAPLYSSLPANLRFTTRVEVKKSDGTYGNIDIPAAYPVDWDAATTKTLEADASASAAGRFIHLDSLYPTIAAESWIVLRTSIASAVPELALRVISNSEMTRTAYAISGKISRLLVEQSTAFPPEFEIRTTAVLGQSERVAPAPAPISDDISGSEISLNQTYLGLRSGQRVVVSGERGDLPGVVGQEVRTLSAVLVVNGYTVLQLDVPLAYPYPRNTVQINANVAPATHGETRAEILGSGDGSQPFQRFALRQPPLTYVSSASATGVASTLEVYVDDVLWTEAPDLYGHGPGERIYSTWTDDEQVTTVQFGDGLTAGARLKTGQDNVRAEYRRGIGTEGLVKAGQLTAPMTRPLGLRGVTNPLPSEGAADPEGLDEARGNVALQVMTLERVVSLLDYEDFSRAFAGVRKAMAVETWDGERRGVFITVAGADGAAINAGSDVHENLSAALRDFGDPYIPVTLATFRPAFFRIDATVTYDPSYLPEKVKPEIGAALRAKFDFDARSFGQPVTLSEVITVIQQIEGVIAVDINELFRTDVTPERHPEPRLGAAFPAGGLAAELLTLDPAPITLR